MTTHVFIVNAQSFPVHLQYLFAGTGAGDKDEHIKLLADISRLRPGDQVIFYLERVGFYGVFRVPDETQYVFADETSPTYLEDALGKKLIYRAKLLPSTVYPNGVSEWEALDTLPVYAQEVIWSLIYRKLKGNRGCTPITLEESQRLVGMIAAKNKNSPPLPPIRRDEVYSWDPESQTIAVVPGDGEYVGLRGKAKDLLAEMIRRDALGRAFEDHLQAYLVGDIGRDPSLEPITGPSDKIVWIGNEVACGVGMQKIDVFTITSDSRENREHRVIELKYTGLYPDIARQLRRYVDWTRSYIKGAINSNIQPVVVAKKILRTTKNASNPRPTKAWTERGQALAEFAKLNDLHIAKTVKVFEYHFEGGSIVFEEAIER